MTQRIGYNIHGQHVPDVPHLINHLKVVRPAWIGVMDNIGLAARIKREVGCNVWVRAWPDDNVHSRMSPEAFIAEWEGRLFGTGLDKGDLWIYTNNESGASEDLAAWLVNVCTIGMERGMRFVVLNTSVGTPHQDDWHQAHSIIELASKHPEHIVIGLHEYACGVITSGFIGGEPGFIQRDEWPDDTSDMTLWHMGRYRFLLRYCRDNDLTPPRILITEWGFDDLGDIKQWSERLIQTPGYANIRGWRSLKRQWQTWFGMSEQNALAAQLFYADDVIYGPEVEGFNIFCWGQSPDWAHNFDVSDALEWQAALAGRVGVEPPVIEPQPEPIPGPPPPPLPIPKPATYVTKDEMHAAIDALRGELADALRLLAAAIEQPTTDSKKDVA